MSLTEQEDSLKRNPDYTPGTRVVPRADAHFATGRVGVQRRWQARAALAEALSPRPRRRRREIALFLAAADFAAALCAVFLSAGIIERAGAPSGIRLLALAGAYSAVVAAARYRRRLPICLRAADETTRIVGAACLPLLVLVLVPWIAADFALSVALCSTAALLATRLVSYTLLRALRAHRLLCEPALVVGTGDMGVIIARALQEHPELGLVPLGFVDSLPPARTLPLPVLGATSELAEVVRRTRAQKVVVCFPVERDRDVAPLLRECQGLPVDIYLVPRLHELGTAVPHSAYDEIWGIPLLPLRQRRQDWAGPVAKRGVDLLLASVALVVCAPLLALVVVVVRLAYGGPVFFRQIRVTGRGRQSTVVKIRTLAIQDSPDTSWAAPTEQCPRFARWLRNTHLDELPQLVNVLRGEMSLVGPRPERPHFFAKFSEEIEGYGTRTRVAGGITGWAQVHGLTGDSSLEERARFDNHYIEWWSIWLDIVVLARTFATVFRGWKREKR